MAIHMKHEGQTKFGSLLHLKNPETNNLDQIIAAYYGDAEGIPKCFYRIFPSLPDKLYYNTHYPNLLLNSWTAKSGSGATTGQAQIQYVHNGTNSEFILYTKVAHLDPEVTHWDRSSTIQDEEFHLPIGNTAYLAGANAPRQNLSVTTNPGGSSAPYCFEITGTAHTARGFLIFLTYRYGSNKVGYFFELLRSDYDSPVFRLIGDPTNSVKGSAGAIAWSGSPYYTFSKGWPLIPCDPYGVSFGNMRYGTPSGTYIYCYCNTDTLTAKFVAGSATSGGWNRFLNGGWISYGTYSAMTLRNMRDNSTISVNTGLSSNSYKTMSFIGSLGNADTPPSPLRFIPSSYTSSTPLHIYEKDVINNAGNSTVTDLYLGNTAGDNYGLLADPLTTGGTSYEVSQQKLVSGWLPIRYPGYRFNATGGPSEKLIIAANWLTGEVYEDKTFVYEDWVPEGTTGTNIIFESHASGGGVLMIPE